MKILLSFLFLSCSTLLFAQKDFSAPASATSIMVNESLQGVSVTSGIKLMLTQGNTSTASYTIASAELSDGFTAELRKGILHLGMNYDVVKKNPKKYKNANIVVYLTAKEINNISSSSGASVETSGTFSSINCEMQCSSGASLEFSTRTTNGSIKVSSGAVVKLSGTITNAAIEVSSGSSMNGADLEIVNVDAKGSSGAAASFGISGALKAKVSSGASIKYFGTPKQLDVKKSSGGSVSQSSK